MSILQTTLTDHVCIVWSVHDRLELIWMLRARMCRWLTRDAPAEQSSSNKKTRCYGHIYQLFLVLQVWSHSSISTDWCHPWCSRYVSIMKNVFRFLFVLNNTSSFYGFFSTFLSPLLQERLHITKRFQMCRHNTTLHASFNKYLIFSNQKKFILTIRQIKRTVRRKRPTSASING